ncbi:MAG: TRAP transporter small permease [Nitrospinota bacterium]|nr:TRAP transporter small permease [Nitrospinota bacterium]
MDEWLAKAESGLLVILIFLMVFFSFGQALLRNFLNTGFLWTDIFLRQLVLWVGFLGASLAVRNRRHISIDVLTHFIPSRFKPILNILIGFLSGLITVFLSYAAWKFVEFEMESPTTLFFDIPAWIFQTILPFSFAVISLRYFLRVYDESVKFWNAR